MSLGESNLSLQRGELSKHLATSERCAFKAASGHGALEGWKTATAPVKTRYSTSAPRRGRNRRLRTHVGYPRAAVGLPTADDVFTNRSAEMVRLRSK
jgi:hypothetical protein